MSMMFLLYVSFFVVNIHIQLWKRDRNDNEMYKFSIIKDIVDTVCMYWNGNVYSVF